MNALQNTYQITPRDILYNSNRYGCLVLSFSPCHIFLWWWVHSIWIMASIWYVHGWIITSKDPEYLVERCARAIDDTNVLCRYRYLDISINIGYRCVY